jgi:hypothetical protein
MTTTNILVCILFVVVCALADPLRYEAENTHIVGSAQRGSYLKGIFFLCGYNTFLVFISCVLGYSGSGFVDFESDAVGSIVFSVFIPSDGLYPFRFVYATSNAAQAYVFHLFKTNLSIFIISGLSIRINGEDQVVSKLETGTKAVWMVQHEDIEFRQGLNSVILKSVNSLNLIRFDFSPHYLDINIHKVSILT